MKFIRENKNRVLILLFVMVSKCVVYFILKLFQGPPISLNNGIDDMVPFVSFFVYFYILWFIFLGLIPILLIKYNKKAFDRYVITAFIYDIIEVCIFAIMPTTMERALFEVNNVSTWIVNIVYMIDYPAFNLFPSSHCAFSYLFIISTFELDKLDKRYRLLIIICSIGIIMSTVFIKQHVLIDSLGALIVIGIYFIIKKNIYKLEKRKWYAKIFC